MTCKFGARIFSGDPGKCGESGRKQLAPDQTFPLLDEVAAFKGFAGLWVRVGEGIELPTIWTYQGYLALCSTILAFTLCFAVASKIVRWKEFATTVELLFPRLLGSQLRRIGAGALVLLEAGIAIAVLFARGDGRAIANAATAILFVAFFAIVLLAWRRQLACGCFGASKKAGRRDIVRSGCLTSIALGVGVVPGSSAASAAADLGNPLGDSGGGLTGAAILLLASAVAAVPSGVAAWRRGSGEASQMPTPTDPSDMGSSLSVEDEKSSRRYFLGRGVAVLVGAATPLWSAGVAGAAIRVLRTADRGANQRASTGVATQLSGAQAVALRDALLRSRAGAALQSEVAKRAGLVDWFSVRAWRYDFGPVVFESVGAEARDAQGGQLKALLTRRQNDDEFAAAGIVDADGAFDIAVLDRGPVIWRRTSGTDGTFASPEDADCTDEAFACFGGAIAAAACCLIPAFCGACVTGAAINCGAQAGKCAGEVISDPPDCGYCPPPARCYGTLCCRSYPGELKCKIP